MCTVTYLPVSENQRLLVSSRDENKSRATDDILEHSVGNTKVAFPVDPISGGSWIATSNRSKTACILNGAFVKHPHSPPYRRSRGLILLDYFQTNDIQFFTKNYVLKGVEPFTMIVCEGKKLWEFRWDSGEKHLFRVDEKTPHIWSSSTLYDQAAMGSRQQWFDQWTGETKDPNISKLIDFHRYGGVSDPYNGLVINRNDKVQTLSITGIETRETYACIHHADLITREKIMHRLDFSTDEIVEPL